MLLLSSCSLVLLLACGVIEVGARSLQLRDMVRSQLSKCASPQTTVGDVEDAASFISVHVATYNEPPSIVIATLEALAQSRNVDFEVLIIDNNTDDEALWRPVERAAKELGARFRFAHIDGLVGAKAGALNIGLAMADPRTTHVAVVDADYQVDRDFLIDGVRSLVAGKVDYVQFPQAYRGVGAMARGVEHELGDYFVCFSGGVGRAGSMLPTGTLSLFTMSALRTVGGWPMETITEDAEIGVRLQAAGLRGLWLARERGKGLLPLDFRGLRKQRARWAAGNLQVLQGLFTRERVKFSAGELTTLVVQLTAWLTLWLPPAAALALVGLAPRLPQARAIGVLSAAIILTSAALTAMRMTIASKAGRAAPWRVRIDALVTKLALTWVSAAAWLPALSDRPLPFHRTLKTIDAAGEGAGWPLAVLSAAFLGLGVAYASRGQGLEAAACGLLASTGVCARLVDRNLRRAARLNPELG